MTRKDQGSTSSNSATSREDAHVLPRQGMREIFIQNAVALSVRLDQFSNRFESASQGSTDQQPREQDVCLVYDAYDALNKTAALLRQTAPDERLRSDYRPGEGFDSLVQDAVLAQSWHDQYSKKTLIGGSDFGWKGHREKMLKNSIQAVDAHILGQLRSAADHVILSTKEDLLTQTQTEDDITQALIDIKNKLNPPPFSERSPNIGEPESTIEEKFTSVQHKVRAMLYFHSVFSALNRSEGSEVEGSEGPPLASWTADYMRVMGEQISSWHDKMKAIPSDAKTIECMSTVLDKIKQDVQAISTKYATTIEEITLRAAPEVNADTSGARSVPVRPRPSPGGGREVSL